MALEEEEEEKGAFATAPPTTFFVGDPSKEEATEQEELDAPEESEIFEEDIPDFFMDKDALPDGMSLVEQEGEEGTDGIWREKR